MSLKLSIEINPRLPYALTLPEGADVDDAFYILDFFNQHTYNEDAVCGDKEFTLVPEKDEIAGTLVERYPSLAPMNIKVKDMTSVLAYRR